MPAEFFRATLTFGVPILDIGWRILRVACRSFVLGTEYVRQRVRIRGQLVAQLSVCDAEDYRVRQNRLTARALQPLLSLKRSGEERKVNTRDSRSRGYHSCCTCCGPSSSRRGFLAGLGALGAALVVPTVAACGQTKPALIDTHLHFYPPEYQKLWLDYEDARKQPHFSGQVAWTRSKRTWIKMAYVQASCRSPPPPACGSTSGQRKRAGSPARARNTSPK